jgi:Xaa-Pro dipeptidase
VRWCSATSGAPGPPRRGRATAATSPGACTPGRCPSRSPCCTRCSPTAQAKGVAAATGGATCESVDATPRAVIEAAGYGDRFIHRTGHGIGVEAHEDPYLVVGNTAPLEAGNAFSIEPGIYLPGQVGLRLEDIVVATGEGPVPLNHADHDLVVVEA